MKELEALTKELELLEKAKVGAPDWDVWLELGTRIEAKKDEIAKKKLELLVKGDLDATVMGGDQ